jgi:hypothetical protein
MGVSEARRKLGRAKKQLERVAVASWDPVDPEEAVTWAFYAYENAVVAVAEKANMQWKKAHWDKTDLAGKIADSNFVSVDVSERLGELNELRKDVQYDEPGPELEAIDLEDLARDLAAFLDEVEKFIESPGT